MTGTGKGNKVPQLVPLRELQSGLSPKCMHGYVIQNWIRLLLPVLNLWTKVVLSLNEMFILSVSSRRMKNVFRGSLVGNVIAW